MYDKLKKYYFTIIKEFINIFLKGPRYFKIKKILFNSIGIKIGEGSKVVGPISINSVAKLEIGCNCWIGRNFKIDGNGSVKIGDNCDLAPEIIISTGSHYIGNKNRRAGEGKNCNTIIGSGTWIGTRSTVIEGSCVGNSCIVAAGSVINKDIKDNRLVGGVPAKTIRNL